MALKNDGIRITLKVFYTSGKVSKVNTRSKRRILATIQRLVSKDIKKYELSVNYMIPKRAVHNEGVYDNKKELLLAYKAFTDNSEIEFTKKYWKEDK